MMVVNSTMGSSLPSNAVPAIADQYNVTSSEQRVLPISVYLIGYVFGPIIWGPLSEQIGRRYLSIGSFSVFCLFTMACGLAPSWEALLVFRFFCGITGSSPIAIVAGILADIYGDPKTRGRAFAVFMAVSATKPSPLLQISRLTTSPRPRSSVPSSPPSSQATAPPPSAGAGPSTSAS